MRIHDLALGTASGRLLRGIVHDRWSDWVTIVSRLGVYYKYPSYKGNEGELARRIFIDALWGYGVIGWRLYDTRAWMGCVDRDVEDAMPREYRALENWLNSLLP